MKKALIGLSLLANVMLAGCEHTVAVAPTVMPAAIAPTATPLTLNDVKWKILTKSDLEALVKQLDANPDPNFVIYTLDNGNFQALNLNLVEIRRFVLEQQQVIVFYQNLEKSEHPDPKPAPKKFLGLF
jgi:hypothetical protein